MAVEGTGDRFDIILIGVGPRGLILLEQLAYEHYSRMRSKQPLRIVVCDPAPFGSGAVWTPDQSGSLLMNVQAKNISVYQCSASERSPRSSAGPDLAQWIERSKGRGLLSRTDQYAPRPVFGEYLTNAYQRFKDETAQIFEISEYHAEAVRVSRGEDHWVVRLEMENALWDVYGRSVVLATGHIQAEWDRAQQSRQHHAEEVTKTLRPCHYIRAGLHSVQDFTRVSPGEAVYLEGLGLGFFDVVALLTEEKGGRWEAGQYVRSGKEPMLLGGSRRGLPFLGRSRLFRAYPGIDDSLERLFDVVESSYDVSFGEELWPEIQRGMRREVTAAIDELYGVPIADKGLVERIETLTAAEFDNWSHADSLRTVSSADTHHERVVEFLADQVELERLSSEVGRAVDPRQRAAEYLQPIRNRIRNLVPGLRFSAASYAYELEAEFSSFAGFITVGPPMLRIEQLLLLVQCGLLRFTGPAKAAIAPEGFSVESSDGNLRVDALVEARVPNLAIDKSASRLMRSLLAHGVAELSIRDGINLHGLSVSVPDGHVRKSGGHVQPGLFAYGVPTEGTYWNTVGGLAGDSEPLIANGVARAILDELPLE